VGGPRGKNGGSSGGGTERGGGATVSACSKNTSGTKRGGDLDNKKGGSRRTILLKEKSPGTYSDVEQGGEKECGGRPRENNPRKRQKDLNATVLERESEDSGGEGGFGE